MYYKHETGTEQAITIRAAAGEDREALRRLAGRDSAPLPAGDLLVALVGDQLRAAVAVSDGQVIADPFHPTAELVRLLRSRVAEISGERGRGPIAALRRRRRSALSPQPAGTLRALN